MAYADPSTPILDLAGDPHDPMMLWAIMCHPHDEPKQQQLLNAYLAFALCDIAKQLNQDTVTIDRATLEAVNSSPSFRDLSVRAAEDARGGQIAGELLLWLLSMHVTGVSEPSIGKALSLMEHENHGRKYRDGTSLPTSHPTLRKYFRMFEPVTHLWASFVLTRQEDDDPACDDVAELIFGMDLPRFLSLAEVLRQFAETTPLPRTNTTLVKPGRLYSIPPRFLGHEGCLEFNPDLGEEIRKQLTAYANRNRHFP